MVQQVPKNSPSPRSPITSCSKAAGKWRVSVPSNPGDDGPAIHYHASVGRSSCRSRCCYQRSGRYPGSMGRLLCPTLIVFTAGVAQIAVRPVEHTDGVDVGLGGQLPGGHVHTEVAGGVGGGIVYRPIGRDERYRGTGVQRFSVKLDLYLDQAGRDRHDVIGGRPGDGRGGRRGRYDPEVEFTSAYTP